MVGLFQIFSNILSICSVLLMSKICNFKVILFFQMDDVQYVYETKWLQEQTNRFAIQNSLFHLPSQEADILCFRRHHGKLFPLQVLVPYLLTPDLRLSKQSFRQWEYFRAWDPCEWLPLNGDILLLKGYLWLVLYWSMLRTSKLLCTLWIEKVHHNKPITIW